MTDTARLTAAVETLQEYCAQVRHVMVARGHQEATVYITAAARSEINGGQSHVVWLHWDGEIDGVECEPFHGAGAFDRALAFAEALPPAPTPADFAATLGIAPDGRVLETEKV